jgi:Domain of unknown function (DUF4160)
MPVVFRHEGFRFFFFSNEGDPREQVHIHVRNGRAVAKFWLAPQICVADSEGFDARTLRELTKMIENNKPLIERTWNEYFR